MYLKKSENEADVSFFSSTYSQDSLYNVLKAFSVYDKEVGYCQGMGFVTGLMLMYMGEEVRLVDLLKFDDDV